MPQNSKKPSGNILRFNDEDGCCQCRPPRQTGTSSVQYRTVTGRTRGCCHRRTCPQGALLQLQQTPLEEAIEWGTKETPRASYTITSRK